MNWPDRRRNWEWGTERMSPTEVLVYVTRRHDGLFACGNEWVMNLSKARIHRKAAPAKAAATRWVKANPGMPVPEVLCWALDVETAAVLNTESETRKRIRRAEVKAVEDQRKRVQFELDRLKDRERQLAEERRKLEEKLGT